LQIAEIVLDNDARRFFGGGYYFRKSALHDVAYTMHNTNIQHMQINIMQFSFIINTGLTQPNLGTE